MVSCVSCSLSEKISRTRAIALGAVSDSSQSRRNALISVSEKPRSCSFWIQSMRVTALPEYSRKPPFDRTAGASRPSSS